MILHIFVCQRGCHGQSITPDTGSDVRDTERQSGPVLFVDESRHFIGFRILGCCHMKKGNSSVHAFRYEVQHSQTIQVWEKYLKCILVVGDSISLTPPPPHPWWWATVYNVSVVSCASNLGCVLSRVCILHDQSPIGSVMTKAISIETALLPPSLQNDQYLSAAPLVLRP